MGRRFGRNGRLCHAAGGSGVYGAALVAYLFFGSRRIPWPLYVQPAARVGAHSIPLGTRRRAGVGRRGPDVVVLVQCVVPATATAGSLLGVANLPLSPSLGHNRSSLRE